MKALAIGAIAVASACGDAGVTDVPSFRFTLPDGVGEAFRRGVAPFDVGWQTDAVAADRLDVVLRLDGTNPEGEAYESPRFPLAGGGARWSVGDGRPGSFRLSAAVFDGDDALATFTHAGIVIAQGIEFRDAQLTFTAASAERDVWITTSTATVFVLELVAVPDADPDARISLARTSVASDLAPVGRVFTWDAALPAGAYTLVADISAADDTVRYSDGTTRVSWQP